MERLSDDLLEGMTAISGYIGKTERAGYHLAAQGQLPVFKKGKKIFARKSELDRAFSAAA